MIMDMLFVDMSADDIGVFALGKPFGKLTAQAVCFLRGDFTGDKGLPQMVGNYIIFTAYSACLLDVLIFSKKKFGIRDPAENTGDGSLCYLNFYSFCPSASTQKTVPCVASCVICSYRFGNNMKFIQGKHLESYM